MTRGFTSRNGMVRGHWPLLFCERTVSIHGMVKTSLRAYRLLGVWPMPVDDFKIGKPAIMIRLFTRRTSIQHMRTLWLSYRDSTWGIGDVWILGLSAARVTFRNSVSFTFAMTLGKWRLELELRVYHSPYSTEIRMGCSHGLRRWKTGIGRQRQ